MSIKLSYLANAGFSHSVIVFLSCQITKIEENNTCEILMFVNSEGRVVVYNRTGGLFYYFNVSCSIHQLS